MALRLTRVKLTNWRNFRGAEVRLEKRAFFIGPNASGKSNFLDALRFLRDLAKPIGGGLATAVAERGGISAIRCLEARNPAHIEIEVDVGNDQNPVIWQYSIRFDQKPRSSYPTVVQETVTPFGEESITLIEKNGEDPEILQQTMIEQVQRRRDFKELSEFFVSIRYLHVVPQIIRDQKRSINELEDPFGGDLLLRIKRLPEKSRLPRLRRIAEALRLAVPQFEGLQLRDDESGKPHLLANYRHWRKRPYAQNETFFSDGTLRLIGLLWSLSEKGGPLLLEEPELSLNDEVTALLPAVMARSQKLSGRQVIATTHSRALLSDSGIGLDEIHILEFTDNGSVIRTGRDDESISTLVTEGNWSIGEAAFPSTRPKEVEKIAQISFDYG